MSINLIEDKPFPTARCATNIQEATALIEAGFQYVTEMDGTKLFKKRK